MGSQPNTRLRALIFLTIAAVAAVALGFVVVNLYARYRNQLAEAEREDPVALYLVAASELHPGLEITENDLFFVEIAPKYLHKSGGPESNLFKNYEQVVGRMPRERILANEFIRNERLADEVSGVGLNALLPRGQRAIAVRLQGGRAVSGFLRPWDYVDVLVTFTPEDGVGAETHYLQQSVLVVGVGANAAKSPDGEAKDPKRMTRFERRREAEAKNTVTLAVSPQQAEMIAHAQELGKITLTLRNNADLDPQDDLRGIGMADLFGVQPEQR
jgi:pilus assembly protein CpaB